MVPFDDKYMISYLMAIVMFAFFQSLLVKIATWKFWHWECRSRSWRTTFAMALFDGKSMTSYLMTMAMFALSLTIYETFANQIKWKKFDLENGQSQGREIRNFAPLDWKCSIPYKWFLLRIVAIRQHTFTQNDTHGHAHSARQLWRLLAKLQSGFSYKLLRLPVSITERCPHLFWRNRIMVFPLIIQMSVGIRRPNSSYSSCKPDDFLRLINPVQIISFEIFSRWRFRRYDAFGFG